MRDAAAIPTPLRVIEATRTCVWCPSQWDGRTDDDRAVYVRYRWGCLRVTVGEPGDRDEFAGVRGRWVYSAEIGDGFDGALSGAELARRTAGVLEWPETVTGETDERYRTPLED